MRIVDLEAKKIINYLYPDQVPILVASGSRTVSGKNVINKGYMCICDSTIVFADKNSLKIDDYDIEDINNVDVKNRWYFWYDVIISLKNRNYEYDICDEVIIKINTNNKNLANEIYEIVQDVITKRNEFIKDKINKGLVRYGIVNEFWGSISEVKKWFEECLIERGFKNIDDKWMTEKDYNDIIKSRNGLIKYINKDAEEWVDIEHYIDEILTPRSFEELLGILFHCKGYKVTNLPYVKDFGLDLIIEKDGQRAGIQAKKYRSNSFEGGLQNKVSAPDIQKALGSIFYANVNKVIFITTSEFTESAIKQTRNAPIELWDRDELCRQILEQLPQIFKKYGEYHVSGEIYKLLKNIENSISISCRPYIHSRIKYLYKELKGDVECSIKIPLKIFNVVEHHYKKVVEIILNEYLYETRSTGYNVWFPGCKSRLENGFYWSLKNAELKLLLEHFQKKELNSGLSKTNLMLEYHYSISTWVLQMHSSSDQF